jgi:hypothetical protein
MIGASQQLWKIYANGIQFSTKIPDGQNGGPYGEGLQVD